MLTTARCSHAFGQHENVVQRAHKLGEIRRSTNLTRPPQTRAQRTQRRLRKMLFVRMWLGTSCVRDRDCIRSIRYEPQNVHKMNGQQKTHRKESEIIPTKKLPKRHLLASRKNNHCSNASSSLGEHYLTRFLFRRHSTLKVAHRNRACVTHSHTIISTRVHKTTSRTSHRSHNRESAHMTALYDEHSRCCLSSAARRPGAQFAAHSNVLDSTLPLRNGKCRVWWPLGLRSADCLTARNANEQTRLHVAHVCN